MVVLPYGFRRRFDIQKKKPATSCSGKRVSKGCDASAVKLCARLPLYGPGTRETTTRNCGREVHVGKVPRSAIVVNFLRVFEPTVIVRRIFRCGVARRNDVAEFKRRQGGQHL